jgi:hypothetical protein
MKTNSSNPNEDIQAIREIMERSSKFLSLSGLAGIFAGVCALIGAAVAWFFIFESSPGQFNEFISNPGVSSTSRTGFYLALDALLILGFALLGAVYFSFRKAKKARSEILDVFNPATVISFIDSAGFRRNYNNHTDISK